MGSSVSTCKAQSLILQDNKIRAKLYQLVDIFTWRKIRTKVTKLNQNCDVNTRKLGPNKSHVIFVWLLIG